MRDASSGVIAGVRQVLRPELRALQAADARFPIEAMHGAAPGRAGRCRGNASAAARRNPGSRRAGAAFSSCRRLKVTIQLSSVPALLLSMPGVSRNRMLCRSFFSADDAVLAQVFRQQGRGNAVFGVFAGGAVEAGHQQRELVGVGHRITGRHMSEAVPRGCPATAPTWRDRWRARRSGTSSHGSGVRRHVGSARHITVSGTNGSGTSGGLGSASVLELAADGAHLLAQLDAQPDRIVPQDLARRGPSSCGRRHPARRRSDRTARCWHASGSFR